MWNRRQFSCLLIICLMLAPIRYSISKWHSHRAQLSKTNEWNLIRVAQFDCCNALQKNKTEKKNCFIFISSQISSMTRKVAFFFHPAWHTNEIYIFVNLKRICLFIVCNAEKAYSQQKPTILISCTFWKIWNNSR